MIRWLVSCLLMEPCTVQILSILQNQDSTNTTRIPLQRPIISPILDSQELLLQATWN